MKKHYSVYIALSLILSFTGCSATNNAKQGDTSTVVPAKNPDPVLLKLYPQQSITPEDFKLLIADPVKTKYPHITVEMIDTKALPIANIVASNEQIDLFATWNGNINSYQQDFGIFGDITPLIKNANFDLGRFDQKALETLRSLSDKGELFGLPYNLQFNALYYNKDIFDRFGVPYPQDGMTWDDTVELTKRLTRTENGVQFSGFGLDGWTRLAYPLSLVPVDAKTNKASVNNDLYRKALNTGKQLFSIPGNPGNFTTNDFIKERKQAMLGGVNYLDQLAKTDINWDVAQFPSYKDNPNVFGMYDLHVMLIPATSKHREDAMKVLEVLFSTEIQKISTRDTGRVSLLNDPEIRKLFGSNNPILKTKKLSSIFKSTPAFAPPFSKFQSKGTSVMGNYYKEFLADNIDLNTMLRGAEEEINQFIKTQ